MAATATQKGLTANRACGTSGVAAHPQRESVRTSHLESLRAAGDSTLQPAMEPRAMMFDPGAIVWTGRWHDGTLADAHGCPEERAVADPFSNPLVIRSIRRNRETT